MPGPRRRSESRLLRRAATAAVAAPMVLAPLALGTVHRGTRTVVFAMCAAALLLALVERMRARRSVTVAPPALPLALAALATALQLIPLPEGILTLLSPSATELGAHTLTLDPAATSGELAKLCAYLAFFLSVSIYCGRSQRRRGLLLVVVATAAVVAAIGILQALTGSETILYFYRPQGTWNTFFGTFVNPNHFGALMALAAPLALAWALAEPRWRWPAYAVVILLNIAVLLSLGRISILSCAAGQLVAVVLVRRQRWPQILAIGIGVLALGVLLLGAPQRLAEQVGATLDGVDFTNPYSKVHVWGSSLQLIGEYPLTGAGRGAFEPAFQHVWVGAGSVRFEWVESAPLQAVLDWGIPVGAAILALAGWAVWLGVRARDREDPFAAGALAGIVALGIHELADFAVELPGVALPALAVLSTLYFRRGETTGVKLVPHPVVWAVPALLILPLIVEMRRPTAAEDGAALAALARNPLVATARVVSFGEAAHRRHPADAYVLTLVAERLGGDRNPDALRWINLAMERNPVHPIPHLMAAELLADTGRKSQALVEYRLATAGMSDPWRLVFPRVRARYPDVTDLMAATPADRRGLGLLADWLRPLSPADAQKVLERLVALEPDYLFARRQLVALALYRRDTETAASHLQKLREVDQGLETMRLAARERMLVGDLVAAARLADGLGDRSAETFEVDLALADALSAAGAQGTARTRLDRLLEWSLSTTQRSRLHEIRAENERRAGNEHQYRWELDQRDRLRKP